MIKASDFKKGVVVEINNAPHIVEQIQVQTPSARGGATLYKTRFRNASTKQKVDRSLKGDDAFSEMNLERKEVQYLYKNGDAYTFMDLSDYEQFDLKADDLGEDLQYLVDDLEGITALLSDGRVLAVEMPDVVEMEVDECDPSIKGASATSRTKPATMATGLTVQVPEYIAPGDRIKIDTRNGSFVSRA